MKSGLLKKLLLFIVITLLVNAVFTAAMFSYTSRNIFANMKADELMPKAEFIAGLVTQYQNGDVTLQTLLRLLDMDKSQWDSTFWDATVHIFNESGELIIHSDTSESQAIAENLNQYLVGILSGEGQRYLLTSSKELGIVVGIPIYTVDAAVSGAVFLTKPLHEVNAALSGLNEAMVFSSLIVLALMVVVAYFGSRRFALPLLQMSQAARAMAQGDFSVRADETPKDEVGELGRSLNELCAALSHTIGDLQLERNRLSNVLNGLNEGILAVDCEGSVTHCNPAAYSLLHAEQRDEQAAMSRLKELWPGIEDVFCSGGQSVHVATLSGIQLRIAVTDILDQDAQRAGAVTMIQDITEEMRLEQTRRDYVANVSHELRTPIASIRSLADALNDGLVKADEDRLRYYGYILRESMRLSRLIDDLLELSRLQSGSVALKSQPFDLRGLFDELENRFTSIAKDSDITFTLALPDGALMACSNEDRVEQVLVALLDNAIKFASDQGSIVLGVEREGDVYVVRVCNTGELQEVHLPHLFERFYKADASHSGQGTGLGLSIVKEVLTLLGERVWAENCGGQACFFFTLRCA